MSESSFNRRKFLEGSAGAAAVAGLGTGSMLWSPTAAAQTLTLKPEKGASLRVLRWSRFVQGDIDAYMVNVKKFQDANIPVVTTGVLLQRLQRDQELAARKAGFDRRFAPYPQP